MAWYGVLWASIPVVLLVTFYPTWGKAFSEDPLFPREMTSIIASFAILEAVVGKTIMNSAGHHNSSPYVLTVMYANAKVVSLFVLIHGAKRLLWAESGTVVGMVLGLCLAFLQLVKIASACVAAVGYIMGRPDENLPTLLEGSCCSA